MKKEIEQLEQDIKNLELLIEIYSSNEQLKKSVNFNNYVDDILDEINEKRNQIRKLKEE
ncbi:MAG: hypothetical protein LBN74_05745 [Prevotella sp.]|jgi:ribosome assembly protein YihI (activator of Der GTPase)|nr:hypothetical protein [Prevotella sp.]